MDIVLLADGVNAELSLKHLRHRFFQQLAALGHDIAELIANCLVHSLLHDDLDAFIEQLEQVVLQTGNSLLDLLFVVHRPAEEVGHPHLLHLDLGRCRYLLNLGDDLGEQPTQGQRGRIPSD